MGMCCDIHCVCDYKNREKRLYDLVESLDEDNLDGIGIHESNHVDCRFPKESYGYRIYHKDGYCFEITFEKMYTNEDETEADSHYEYYGGEFEGFKEISLEESIKLILEEGVFI